PALSPTRRFAPSAIGKSPLRSWGMLLLHSTGSELKPGDREQGPMKAAGVHPSLLHIPGMMDKVEETPVVVGTNFSPAAFPRHDRVPYGPARRFSRQLNHQGFRIADRF